MTLAGKIRAECQEMIIQHPRFAAASARVESLVADHESGLEPVIEVILAPSRGGKTEVLRSLERTMPPYRENGRLIRPILFVSIASGSSPKDLPASVINALGVPQPRDATRSGALRQFMYSRLKLAGVKHILFDEVSHLVDEGSHTPPRLAADWFKDLHLHSGVSMVLSGIYRLQRLIDCNEQLKGRARKAYHLDPYRWDSAEDRLAFAGCVHAFADIFTEYDCPFINMPGMSFDLLLRNLYAASAGIVGRLARFFDELGRTVAEPGPLSSGHFAEACSHINLPGNGMVQPFAGATLADEHLMHVLSSELARYDLVLKPHTAAGELGNAMNDAWRKRA